MDSKDRHENTPALPEGQPPAEQPKANALTFEELLQRQPDDECRDAIITLATTANEIKQERDQLLYDIDVLLRLLASFLEPLGITQFNNLPHWTKLMSRAGKLIPVFSKDEEVQQRFAYLQKFYGNWFTTVVEEETTRRRARKQLEKDNRKNG